MSETGTAGQTDMKKLIVAMRKFAKAPKKTVSEGSTVCAGKNY